MIEIGVLEAKTRLSALLEMIEKGEGPIAITRYGKRVAVLSKDVAYAEPAPLSGAELANKLRAFREKQAAAPELDGLSWDELKDEMRK
ncbi:MAG: type II toxin-antitoxin system Phd/YefM family antitoxin [Alphaproteobacteria bacterium]|jgi:antitoxin (DNA-binding transcriptional repressor) of toxin-antitoxin stability system|uniref:type II toxin-antitoxin system Phd/YefM family antitoxin n=1 Tax=Maricaulis alexandrii TaxID=2570354 RepID=UPI0011086E9D|nr:type II toxin-antitoxin system Phd/YefM family antitoxin [Maricaulis alexandrii]MCR9266748.1 type II toxin-antitoxin system Phd/YefM family antitoxin [Alphaproteobacteria bacterium]